MEPESVMTDKMREAMIDKDGAVWEKIGGAWSLYKPAQAEPVEVFDSRCNYASFAGRVCNKCGRIHDGGLGGMVGGEQVSKAEEKAAEADELRKYAELGKCISVKFRLMKGSTAVRFLGCLGVNEPEGGFDWSKTVLELIDAAIAQEPNK